MSTQGQEASVAVSVEISIAEARGGSRVALERLLESCIPYLLAVAQRGLCASLRPRLDPVDVVQDTLLKAWRNFLQFRGASEADFLAWIVQILRHHLANERRQHVQSAMRSIRREVHCVKTLAMLRWREIDSQSGSCGCQAATLERCRELETALRRLPTRYRHVLELHTQEEMTFAQVGERLRCSAEAARKLWGRAAEKLARLLGDGRNF